MKCLNLIHRHGKTLLPLLAFFLLPIFSLGFSSESASAISSTCDLTSYLPFSASSISFGDYCDFSSLDSSKDWSWTFNFDVGDSQGNAFDLIVQKTSTYGGLGEFYVLRDARFLEFCSSYPNALCSSKNPYSVVFNDYSTKTNNTHFSKLSVPTSNRWSYFSSFSVVVSDSSSPTGSLSITANGTYDVSTYAEAVVEVPDTETIIQGDYHDDLVDIKNIALVAIAVALFICFGRLILGMFMGVRR